MADTTEKMSASAEWMEWRSVLRIPRVPVGEDSRFTQQEVADDQRGGAERCRV